MRPHRRISSHRLPPPRAIISSHCKPSSTA